MKNLLCSSETEIPEVDNTDIPCLEFYSSECVVMVNLPQEVKDYFNLGDTPTLTEYASHTGLTLKDVRERVITIENTCCDESGGGGGILSIVPGDGITVDNTDPDNPIISADLIDLSGYVTIDTPQVITGEKDFFSTTKFNSGMILRPSDSVGEVGYGGIGYSTSDLFYFKPTGISGQGSFNFNLNTDNRNYTYPDKSGTVALLDDVSTPSLQDVIDQGNTAVGDIILNGNFSGATASFTGLVKGVDPINPEDLATKQYVDDNSGSGTNQNLSQVLSTGNTAVVDGTSPEGTQGIYLTNSIITSRAPAIDINVTGDGHGMRIDMEGSATGEGIYISNEASNENAGLSITTIGGTTSGSISSYYSGSGNAIYSSIHAEGDSYVSNVVTPATGFNFVGQKNAINTFTVDGDGLAKSAASVSAIDQASLDTLPTKEWIIANSGGGTPSLQQVTDVDGSTTNDITSFGTITAQELKSEEALINGGAIDFSPAFGLVNGPLGYNRFGFFDTNQWFFNKTFGGESTVFNMNDITATRTLTIPDKSGTIALLDDVTGVTTGFGLSTDGSGALQLGDAVSATVQAIEIPDAKLFRIGNISTQDPLLTIDNDGTTKAISLWAGSNAIDVDSDQIFISSSDGISNSTRIVLGPNLISMQGDVVNETSDIQAASFTLSALNTAPASATDTGTTGEIRYTSTYIYVCIATNTWVRSDLVTW